MDSESTQWQLKTRINSESEYDILKVYMQQRIYNPYTSGKENKRPGKEASKLGDQGYQKGILGWGCQWSIHYKWW